MHLLLSYELNIVIEIKQINIFDFNLILENCKTKNKVQVYYKIIISKLFGLKIMITNENLLNFVIKLLQMLN
jgi:hypothetical protein